MKRISHFVILSMALGGCADNLQERTKAEAIETAEPNCEVSAQDRDSARQLAWYDFDQVSEAPGSYRVLSDNGCYEEALEAYSDWLTHGPGFPDGRARAIGTFHQGQLHALLDDTDRAVPMIGQSFREVGEDDPQAEVWNLYLQGVLGYFAGDIERIDMARVALADFPDNPFAQRQIGVLDGLKRCIERPYRVAIGDKCIGIEPIGE